MTATPTGTAEEFLVDQLRSALEVHPDYDILIEGNFDKDVHITEITMIKPGAGGCSYLRSDGEPLVLALMAASEDIIRYAFVEPFRPDGWESEIDDRDDAVLRLKRVADAMAKA